MKEALVKEAYGELWDRYVSVSFPKLQEESDGKLFYPGSEWGSEQFWNAIFDHLFVPAHVAQWKYAIEIGGGGGKYTERVLAANDQVRVWGFDVSRNFLDSTAARLSRFVDVNRLMLNEIDSVRPDAMLRLFEKDGLVRKIDAMFSIDAMVHVDLQYLVTYWINAALLLKPGGVVVMTLADPTSEVGFQKLMRDIKKFYRFQGRMCPKFEFLSKPIVTHVLESLGFAVDYLEQWGPSPNKPARDLYLIARLDRPGQADGFRDAITSEPTDSDQGTSSSDASLERAGPETYGEFWDRHVASGRAKLAEDDAEYWNAVCDQLFARCEVNSWNNAIEIGCGEGKFARRVLTANERTKLWCFDVSRNYLENTGRSLRQHVDADRLHLNLIDGGSPDAMVRLLEQRSGPRTFDAVFSVDAMVHADLQYLVTHWVNAALLLRKGGWLIMTLADATSPGGFSKLIGDIRNYYRLQGRACAKYEYVSANMVSHVLERLGFEVKYLEQWAPSPGVPARDLLLVAKLARPEQADTFRSAISAGMLLPAGPLQSPTSQAAKPTHEHAGAMKMGSLTEEQRAAAVALGKAYWRTLLVQSDPALTKEQLKEKLKDSWGGSRREYTRLGVTVLKQLENTGYVLTKNPIQKGDGKE